MTHIMYNIIRIMSFIFYLTAKYKHNINNVSARDNGTLTLFFKGTIELRPIVLFAKLLFVTSTMR